MSSPSPQRSSLTDSPLFWFFLFGTMALVGVLAIGPKYAARQERINRMQGVRDRLHYSGTATTPGQAAENNTTDDTSLDDETAAHDRPTLIYLSVFLYVLMLLVGLGVTLRNRRRQANDAG
jgi:hypothetical protein